MYTPKEEMKEDKHYIILKALVVIVWSGCEFVFFVFSNYFPLYMYNTQDTGNVTFSCPLLI